MTTIHNVLRHVHSHGFPLIAVPVANLHGSTITTFDDGLWELAPWLAGGPVLHESPTAAMLANALRQLAVFHRAASSYEPRTRGTSPGLKQRLDEMHKWQTSRWSKARSALLTMDSSDLLARSQRAYELFQRSGHTVVRELKQAVDVQVPLQYCIRDARAEHFLFVGNEVSGVIDFGAMRRESPAGDIARLVGTSGELPDKWSLAVASYIAENDLSGAERELVPVFYRSGVILGALNWIWWTAVEQRKFESWQGVLDRLDALLRQWSQLEAAQPQA